MDKWLDLASKQKRILSVGECMLELSGGAHDQWNMGVAGDTLNTAWYARAMLEDDWQVGYFTRIGKDKFSDRIENFLSFAGIDTAFVQRDPDRGPGLYAISLDQGERSFTYWRNDSAARHLADDPDALTRGFAESDLIYFSGITLAILTADRRESLLAALQYARSSGSRVAFDPNTRPALCGSGPQEAAVAAHSVAANVVRQKKALVKIDTA